MEQDERVEGEWEEGSEEESNKRVRG